MAEVYAVTMPPSSSRRLVFHSSQHKIRKGFQLLGLGALTELAKGWLGSQNTQASEFTVPEGSDMRSLAPSLPRPRMNV